MVMNLLLQFFIEDEAPTQTESSQELEESIAFFEKLRKDYNI